MLDQISGIVVRRPRRVVIGVALLALVAGALGGGVADRLAPYGADDPASESYRAERLLERSGANASTDVVALVRPRQSVRSAAGRAEVLRVAAELRRDPDVARVTTFREGGSALVSRDGRASYVAASFRPQVDSSDAAERLRDRFEGRPRVELGGGEIANVQANEQVSEDLAKAELLAIPFLFALSFLFFRSGVAALLPPMVGLTTILLTFLSLRLASEIGSVSVFALNLVTGLGLGLAIDYSLFVVSRFREEMEKSPDRGEALRRTLATAGRTVLFSSLTVAAAMSSLIVFPQRFLYSMGIGGVLVALLASTVALTLLPAVLMLLGPRVNALAPRRLQRAREREARGEDSGGWYRLSRFVMRRPGRVAIASAATLIALGIPFFSIAFTAVNASVLPTSASARQVDETLRRDFPPHRTSPTFLAVESGPGPRVAAYVAAAAASGRRCRGVAAAAGGPRPHPGERGVEVRPPHQEERTARGGRARPRSSVRGVGRRVQRPLPRPAREHRPPPPRGPGNHRRGHARGPVRHDRFRGAPGQGGADERAHPQRHLRRAGADLPGRALRGAARLLEPGRARDHPADRAARPGVRAVHRLRRVPALPHQGGPRPRCLRPRGGGPRAAAHGPHRHGGGAAVLHRHRRLRHLAS